MRGFKRGMALVFVVGLACALLLCSIDSPGFAASPSHGCAPLAPPPVAGSPVPPPSTPGIVVFNEILTTPGSRWNCAEPVGAYSIMSDSWVELYNQQSQPYNLYAAHAFIDTGDNTFRFYLPFGAAIAPHGYLATFANSANDMLVAGANLRLVLGTTGTVIDQVSVPALITDDSYARIPDGSPTWEITTTPTIDASNMLTSSTTTPTPAATSTSGSSGTGTGGGTIPHATATPWLATGTQPAWNSLSLPQATAGAIPTVAAANSSPATTPTPTNDVADVQRHILMTVLLCLLGGSLFWCWKIFASTKA